jgi:hypothetical protein
MPREDRPSFKYYAEVSPGVARRLLARKEWGYRAKERARKKWSKDLALEETNKEPARPVGQEPPLRH